MGEECGEAGSYAVSPCAMDYGDTKKSFILGEIGGSGGVQYWDKPLKYVSGEHFQQ